MDAIQNAQRGVETRSSRGLEEALGPLNTKLVEDKSAERVVDEPGYFAVRVSQAGEQDEKTMKELTMQALEEPAKGGEAVVKGPSETRSSFYEVGVKRTQLDDAAKIQVAKAAARLNAMMKPQS